MAKCPNLCGLALFGVKSFPPNLASGIINHGGVKTLQIAHSDRLPDSYPRVVPFSDVESLIIRRGGLVRLQFDHVPFVLTRDMISALRRNKSIRQLIVARPTKKFMSDLEHRVLLVNSSAKSIIRSNHVITSVKGQCEYMSLHRILGINSLQVSARMKVVAKLFLMRDTFLQWAKALACNCDTVGRHQFIRCAVVAMLGGDGNGNEDVAALGWLARAPLALVNMFLRENLMHLIPV